MSDQCLAAGTGGSVAVSEENSKRYVSETEVMFNALPEDIRLAWERIAAHLNATIPEIVINEDTALCQHEAPWDLWEVMRGPGIINAALAMFAGVDIDPVIRDLTEEEWNELVNARECAKKAAKERRQKAAKERSRQLRKEAKAMV